MAPQRRLSSSGRVSWFRTLYSAATHLPLHYSFILLLRRKCRAKTFSRLRQKPRAFAKTTSDTVSRYHPFLPYVDYRNTAAIGAPAMPFERAITYLTEPRAHRHN